MFRKHNVLRRIVKWGPADPTCRVWNATLSCGCVVPVSQWECVQPGFLNIAACPEGHKRA